MELQSGDGPEPISSEDEEETLVHHGRFRRDPSGRGSDAREGHVQRRKEGPLIKPAPEHAHWETEYSGSHHRTDRTKQKVRVCLQQVGAGCYESSISQEKQDARSGDQAGSHRPVKTDKAGRLILETPSDLQNLLILRKSKRERKCAAPSVAAPPAGRAVPYYVDEDDFWEACDHNDLPVIERYLTTGGDVDASDVFKRTGLHRACSHGYAEVVARLIEAGASINSRDKLWSTCVHAACRGGHLSVLQLLLEHGADVAAADKLDSTPLHVSVRTGHLDCVEYLIHNGASVDTQDREGDTPLHDAVRQNRLKIIQLLLLQGADTRVANQDGRRPLDDVLEWQNETKTLLNEQNDRK